MKAWNRKSKKKHTTKVKYRNSELIYEKGIGLTYLDSKAFSITTHLENGERIIVKFKRYSVINVSKNSHLKG